MTKLRSKWLGLRSVTIFLINFSLAFAFVSAERRGKSLRLSTDETRENESSFFLKAINFLWESDQIGYRHVWPEFEFNWQIVLGTLVGFFGAAFGSVGGVGGGGIFVPMLSLIIGFDPKSATAISKCMIMGASVSTVYYNLRLRHPTLDMPIIDYDLALLIQPMLMLGISIGVAFNVIFPDWLVTVLLIVLFLGTSTKAFLKGSETWNKETIEKKEAAKRLESNGVSGTEVEYVPLPAAPSTNPGNKKKEEVSIIENVYWKELGLLVFVWIVFLALQISKVIYWSLSSNSHIYCSCANFADTFHVLLWKQQNLANCSVAYWVINLLQIPVAVGVSGYEAVALYQGRRIIASKGQGDSNFTVGQLVMYCTFGIIAGIVGGLLGLGGGFIMGPLFLELGVPPQV
jgi:uncharacterized membrane protein YfcA